MRLDQRLASVAEGHPDKLALDIVGGEQLSFQELVSASDSVARELIRSGVGSGDRVAIFSGHDHRAIILLWGILRAGAIVVWMNHDPRGSGLASALSNAKPRVIFVQGEPQRRLAEAAVATGASIRLLSELDFSPGEEAGAESAARDTPPLPSGLPETDPAAIVYTSGSSGEPKGVCLSHRNLTTVMDAVIGHMPISADDSYLMVVPLHYVHGLMQLFVHALAGATIHYYDNFLFPRKVVDALLRTRATGFSGVPFHFNALIERGGLLEAELPDLRWMTVTGGKLRGSTILRILDRFPALDFHIAYGQTECAPRATALHPRRTRRKLDSVGSPIPGVQVELVDEHGRSVASGETGEVVVSGDNVMLGYWRDAAATAEVIDEQGRLRTGDIGRFDEEGDLFLLGRRSAMIKSAGERIIPGEIERVLSRHGAIADAVVVGVEDSALGQRVVAHVELLEKTDEDAADEASLLRALRAHALERLPPSRAPREYHLWSAFPRKANGKADRQAIACGVSDE